MTRKLTITVSDELYTALRQQVGPGRIARFIEQHVRPHLRLAQDLDRDYAEYARHLETPAGRSEANEVEDWLSDKPPGELATAENEWPTSWYDNAGLPRP